MAKLLKLRRGTTSEHSSFTGAEGEVTVDTTKDTVVVHDGSTAGGTPLAKESAVTAIPAVIDEDNMASNSATRPPSQQSVKAYVDAVPAVIDEDNMASDSATRPPSQQSAKAYTDSVGNGIMNSVALRAPINNPTLTGTVTVPTASANDNTTKAASTAYVQTELGDYAPLVSPTFTGTPTVPGYAPLASPALTGTATGVNLTLSGNLTVNGTTTTVATTNTTLTDNLIELNSGASSNANDSGILIERGSTGDNAIIAWDESADKFTVGTTTGTASSTGDISITTGTLVANIEGNVTGSGANLTSLPAAQVSGTLGSCNASNLTSIPAGQLTGTLPAISGANLTNLPGGGGELSVTTSGSLSVGDRMGFNSSGYAVKLGSIISQNNPPSNVSSGNNGTSSVSPNTHTCAVYMPALGVWVAFVGETNNSTGRIKIFKYSNGSWTWSSSNMSIPNTSGRAAHMIRMTDTKILYAHAYATNARIQPYIITLTASSDSTGYTASYSTPSSSSGAQQFSVSGSTSYNQYWAGNDEHLQMSRVSSTKAVIAFQGNVGSYSGASNHTVVGVVEFTNTNLTQWNAGSCAQASSTGGIGQATRLCKIASNKWAVAMEGDTRCAIRAFSVSGTSVSFGTRVVVDESGSGGDYQNIGYDPTSDRVIVSWINQQSSGARYIAIYSHSGNYLTKQGSNHTLYSSGGSARMSWCPIGNMGSYWFLSLYGGQGGSNDMQVIRVNSSSITEYSEGNGFSSSNPYTSQQDGGAADTASGVKFDTASGHILRLYGYSGNNLYYDSFNCGVGTPTHTGYIGCYKSSGTVYVAGGVATGLSGLTPGTAYYTDSTGTLSTDSTSRTLAGVAKTSTTMLVR